MTCDDVLNSRCAPHRTYYLPFNSHCHSFCTCEVMGGGEGIGGGAEDKKKKKPSR